MADEMMIMCVPVGAVPESELLDAAGQRWCGLCGTQIWVSTGSLKMIDDGKALPVCTPCGYGSMPGRDVDLRAVPGAVKSLRASGITDAEIERTWQDVKRSVRRASQRKR